MKPKRVIHINNRACQCCPSLAEELFCALKAAGMALRNATEVLTRITAWETRHMRIAPPIAYFGLYMAIFRDVFQEDAAIYLPSYHSMLNLISVRHGSMAAFKTLVVLRYANEVLGVILFPSDLMRQPWQAQEED